MCMAYLREIEVKYKIRKIESEIIDQRVTGPHVIAPSSPALLG